MIISSRTATHVTLISILLYTIYIHHMYLSRSPPTTVDEIPPTLIFRSGYRIWLFGDSILDNYYWNNVGRDTTGEWLKRLLGNVDILDRTTSGIEARTYRASLTANRRLPIAATHEARVRARLGIPYVPNSGRINPNPEMHPNDFIFISLGSKFFKIYHR